MKKIWFIIGTLFGVGYLPVLPGTYASAVSTIIAYFFISSFPKSYQVVYYFLFLTLGIIASYKIQNATGEEDPRYIVIDEYVGQGIALIMADDKILLYIIGFFAFRAFDIIKVFPVDRLAHLKHGFGVMLDDVMAGIYAGLIVIIIKL